MMSKALRRLCGAELLEQDPNDWKDRLEAFRAVNWSKKNPDWDNVCIIANSVVSNRQARVATKPYLKHKLGLALTEAETHSLEKATVAEANAEKMTAQDLRLRELTAVSGRA
jgi:DNA sulfur modification protein DndB